MEDNERLNYDEKVMKELKQDIKDLEKRVLAIETSREKTDYQYEQIMKAIDELNNKTIPNLMQEINELKNKPAKRYDSFISGILGAMAGAIGASIVNIFKK